RKRGDPRTGAANHRYASPFVGPRRLDLFAAGTAGQPQNRSQHPRYRLRECRSMYPANGPIEMRPVDAVEFVSGIAAMSASGGYGPIKVAQGIVGYADLALGEGRAGA